MANPDCDGIRMSILRRRGGDGELLGEPASLYMDFALDAGEVYESLLDHGLLDASRRVSTEAGLLSLNSSRSVYTMVALRGLRLLSESMTLGESRQ